jgi:hypothetical protein
MAEDIWSELVGIGRRRLFQPGQVLLRQGTSATSVVVLTDGIVRVRQGDEQGRRLTITLRGPGEVLGEYGVLLQRPRSASVEAALRCTGYVVPAAAFRRFAERHELTSAILRLAVERLEQREHLDTGLAHPTSDLQDLYQNHLGRLRAARRSGQGDGPARRLVSRPPEGRGSGRQLVGQAAGTLTSSKRPPQPSSMPSFRDASVSRHYLLLALILFLCTD